MVAHRPTCLLRPINKFITDPTKPEPMCPDAYYVYPAETEARLTQRTPNAIAMPKPSGFKRANPSDASSGSDSFPS